MAMCEVIMANDKQDSGSFLDVGKNIAPFYADDPGVIFNFLRSASVAGQMQPFLQGAAASEPKLSAKQYAALVQFANYAPLTTAENSVGRVALSKFIANKNVIGVKQLLKIGVSAILPDENGLLPLEALAISINDIGAIDANLAIMQLLFSYGADPFALGIDGVPVAEAFKKPSVSSVLRRGFAEYEEKFRQPGFKPLRAEAIASQRRKCEIL